LLEGCFCKQGKQLCGFRSKRGCTSFNTFEEKGLNVLNQGSGYMTVIEKWPEDDIDSLRHILFLKLLQYERKGLTTKPLNRLIPILKKPLSKNLEE